MVTCCLLWNSITKRLRAMILSHLGSSFCSEIKAWRSHGRLGKLSLGDISTTGRPRGDVERLYSSCEFSKFHFISDMKFPILEVPPRRVSLSCKRSYPEEVGGCSIKPTNVSAQSRRGGSLL